MRGIVKDAQGQVRSGWVLLVFASCAGLLDRAVRAGISWLGLYPVEPIRVDDWKVFFTSSSLLVAASAGMLACRIAFGPQPDDSTPLRERWFAVGGILAVLVITLCSMGPVLAGAASATIGAAGAAQTFQSGLMQLLTIGPSSVGEELLLRGFAFRQLARGTHPVVAVLASGTVFAALHLENPDVSRTAAINIALAGFWFGALVLRTGSLWATIGLHLLWNWCESFVFGLPLSGILPAASLLSVSSPARGFWGGGEFGPEASGLTSLVLFAALGVTIFWPRGKKAPTPPVEGLRLTNQPTRTI